MVGNTEQQIKNFTTTTEQYWNDFIEALTNEAENNINALTEKFKHQTIESLQLFIQECKPVFLASVREGNKKVFDHLIGALKNGIKKITNKIKELKSSNNNGKLLTALKILRDDLNTAICEQVWGIKDLNNTYSILHYAAEAKFRKELDKVEEGYFLKVLLNLGQPEDIARIINKHESYKNGNTLLCFAAMRNRSENIKYLLDHGGIIDKSNDQDYTPLHLAIRKNAIDATKLLLERGANPNTWARGTTIDSSCYFITSFDTAVRQKKNEIIILLLKYGYDLRKNYNTAPKQQLLLNKVTDRKTKELIEYTFKEYEPIAFITSSRNVFSCSKSELISLQHSLLPNKITIFNKAVAIVLSRIQSRLDFGFHTREAGRPLDWYGLNGEKLNSLKIGNFLNGENYYLFSADEEERGGKIYFIPAGKTTGEIINKLLTSLLYESYRNNWNSRPCTIRRQIIQLLNPLYFPQTNSDYGESSYDYGSYDEGNYYNDVDDSNGYDINYDCYNPHMNPKQRIDTQEEEKKYLRYLITQREQSFGDYFGEYSSSESDEEEYKKEIEDKILYEDNQFDYDQLAIKVNRKKYTKKIKNINKKNYHLYSEDEVNKLIQHYNHEVNTTIYQYVQSETELYEKNILFKFLELNHHFKKNLLIVIPYKSYWAVLWFDYKTYPKTAHYLSPIDKGVSKALEKLFNQFNILLKITNTPIHGEVKKIDYHSGPWVVETARMILETSTLPISINTSDLYQARINHMQIIYSNSYRNRLISDKEASNRQDNKSQTANERSDLQPYYFSNEVSEENRLKKINIAKRDLAKFNQYLREGLSPAEAQAKVGTKFLVAQYRGITYDLRWNQPSRRAHRKAPEEGLPVYSRSVYTEVKFNIFTQYDFKNQTNATMQKKLHDIGSRLKKMLLAMRNDNAYKPKEEDASYSGKQEVFNNLATYVQGSYTKNYIAFHRDLEEGALKKYVGGTSDNNEQYFINADNPFISTGDIPYHALRYAYGAKPYGNMDDKRSRARWRRTGKAERPTVGKLYVSVHPTSDYGHEGPFHVPTLNNQKQIAIPQVILAERETTFPAFMDKNRVVYQQAARFPSFHRAYKKSYLEKYGLDEETYNLLAEVIRGTLPHSNERRYAQKILANWLCVFHEAKLIEIASEEAAKQGGILVYQDMNGGFSMELPNLSGETAKQEPQQKYLTPLAAVVSAISGVVSQYYSAGTGDLCNVIAWLMLTTFLILILKKAISAGKSLGYQLPAQEENPLQQVSMFKANKKLPPAANNQAMSKLEM